MNGWVGHASAQIGQVKSTCGQFDGGDGKKAGRTTNARGAVPAWTAFPGKIIIPILVYE
jgi:hypothetical protein